MQRRPPFLALLLLRLLLSRASYEAIAGDLCEEFQDATHSSRWFWRQVMSTLRPRWRPTPDWTDIRAISAHGNWFEAAIRDFRYALRMLWKTPGFTAVAIGAIALGIGANTGIFTFLNALALRPLPVRDASNIISIYQSLDGLKTRNILGSESLFSYAEYETYRDGAQSLSGLTAYLPYVQTTLTGTQSGALHGELVACNYFDVLGEAPHLGRGFSEANCSATADSAVVVLSDPFWRSKFNADLSILGQTVTLSRHQFTVIGIGPPGFTGVFMVSADFWAPIASQPVLLPQVDWRDPNLSWLCLLGRLKYGVTPNTARADLQRIAHTIDNLEPGRKTRLVIDVASLFSEPRARKRLLTAGTVVLVGVTFVLLISCANVANLLLARAAHRQREIAVRLSIGASRGRIVRQLLAESILISVLGGLLGTAVAHVAFRAIYIWFLANLPHQIPPLALNLSFDWRLWAYAFTISVATGIAFGLLPALESTKVDLASSLKDESHLSGKRSRRFVRSVLMGAQVTVCLTLLVAAGLLGRGLITAQNMDPGFTTANIVTASFDLQRDGYTETSATVFYNQLLSRLQSSSAVASAALSRAVPLAGGRISDMPMIEGQTKLTEVSLNQVSPSFFRTLDIPIVHGRGFDNFENDDSHAVAIVSQSTARRLWPGADPLGKWIRFGSVTSQVIGVAKDVYTTDLTSQNVPFVYRPLQRKQLNLSVLVRGPDVGALKHTLRAEVRALDPKLYFEMNTLDEWRHFWTVPGRTLTMLAAALGAVALLLACSGVYGVVNYDVNRRIHEIGVRMTLGAKPVDVFRMLAFQCLRPVLLGCLFGLCAAAALTKVMVALLFGISPLDPLTFAVMPSLLVSAAAVAAYPPAIRATRVDPASALRHE